MDPEPKLRKKRESKNKKRSKKECYSSKHVRLQIATVGLVTKKAVSLERPSSS